METLFYFGKIGEFGEINQRITDGVVDRVVPEEIRSHVRASPGHHRRHQDLLLDVLEVNWDPRLRGEGIVNHLFKKLGLVTPGYRPDPHGFAGMNIAEGLVILEEGGNHPPELMPEFTEKACVRFGDFLFGRGDNEIIYINGPDFQLP